jgi:hypothetical protein
MSLAVKDLKIAVALGKVDFSNKISTFSGSIKGSIIHLLPCVEYVNNKTGEI